MRQLARTQAAENLALGQQNPLEGVDVNMLMGEGDQSTTAAQARIPPEGLQQVKQLMLHALKSVPEAGKQRQPFVHIKPEPGKPFMKFLDRLNDALQKQVENEAARDYILKQLAVENANPDCQKALQPLKNPSIDDMISACMHIGSRQHELSLLTEAFAAMTVKSQQSYFCGQYRHFQKNCSKANTNKGGVPGICPCCQRTTLCQSMSIQI